MVISAELMKWKGAEYLQTKETPIKLQFGGAMAHFDNLFNGDALLSKYKLNKNQQGA